MSQNRIFVRRAIVGRGNPAEIGFVDERIVGVEARRRAQARAIEVWIVEQIGERVVTTPGMAPHAHALQIHPRAIPRKVAQPRSVICGDVTPPFLVRHIVERLRALWRAARV
jgi:hypothetical protein